MFQREPPVPKMETEAESGLTGKYPKTILEWL